MTVAPSRIRSWLTLLQCKRKLTGKEKHIWHTRNKWLSAQIAGGAYRGITWRPIDKSSMAPPWVPCNFHDGCNPDMSHQDSNTYVINKANGICLVPNCPGILATGDALCCHFFSRHHYHTVVITEESVRGNLLPMVGQLLLTAGPNALSTLPHWYNFENKVQDIAISLFWWKHTLQSTCWYSGEKTRWKQQMFTSNSTTRQQC